MNKQETLIYQFRKAAADPDLHGKTKVSVARLDELLDLLEACQRDNTYLRTTVEWFANEAKFNKRLNEAPR